MKLEQAWERSKDYSGKVSDLIRQYAFAGIAMIWVLRPDGGQIEDEMVVPAIMLFVGLMLDMLQYISGTLRFRQFAKECKKAAIAASVPDEKHGEWDFKLPENYLWPVAWLFWGKLLSTLSAYVVIVCLLARRFVL